MAPLTQNSTLALSVPHLDKFCIAKTRDASVASAPMITCNTSITILTISIPLPPSPPKASCKSPKAVAGSVTTAPSHPSNSVAIQSRKRGPRPPPTPQNQKLKSPFFPLPRLLIPKSICSGFLIGFPICNSLQTAW